MLPAAPAAAEGDGSPPRLPPPLVLLALLSRLDLENSRMLLAFSSRPRTESNLLLALELLSLRWWTGRFGGSSS